MKIEQRQILQFLKEQNRSSAVREAEVELPAEIDVDEPAHRVILRELAIDPEQLRSFVARVDPR